MKSKMSIFVLSFILAIILVGCGNEQKEEIPVSNKEAGQASLVNEEPSQEVMVKIGNIDDFSLDIKFQNGDEVDYEYEVKSDRIEAEIERTTNGTKEELIGEQALMEIQNLIEKVDLTSNKTGEQLTDQFLQALHLKREDIKFFDLEIRFSDGKKIEVKF